MFIFDLTTPIGIEYITHARRRDRHLSVDVVECVCTLARAEKRANVIDEKCACVCVCCTRVQEHARARSFMS